MKDDNKRGQLGRNAAIYGGALLLPRLAAFVALIVFSRIVEPAEYGYFALFVTSAELLNAVLFNWIRLALLRLYPEYESAGRISILRRTCLAMTGLATAVSIPVGALMALVAAPERTVAFSLLLGIMTFANGVVRLRLAELQAQERSLQYFGIEVSRATLSLVLSLALVELAGSNFETLSAGFALASLGVALVCLIPFVRELSHLGLDRPAVKTIVSYAGPIVPITVLESLIPLTERYVIQLVAGPAAVGIYAATQNLVQQPINMLASAVGLAAFPIVMRSAEREGNGSAQSRMGEVGSYLLALGLPAVAGLIMLRTEIASVVLGEQFRGQAAALIPWIAATALLVNLKFHYFDLAFHVTRRLMVQVASLLPATLLTAPFIYVFLKMFGLPGAAAGSCLAFSLSVLASWLAGRRLLAIPHALGEIARIGASAVVMVGVLAAIGPLDGIAGLVVLVMAGGGAFAGAALAFNVLDIRPALLPYTRWLPGKAVRAS
ncbi:lipopolysaccharide biosynthesis protein [Methyloceanibacter sp.]|uniref:lipopolysaccharide biosynthesis protein n=1 Tax=Methyloceanibacter sp. TaxID=1965321 RepID=UPI002D37186D|nr:lipopolysaccharide biosynthesis protein [Methyloceanibacter sp.]HZP08106.1 lipopolysaccharide biosynthesis protein [Methyloceanibacter sp.]